MFVHDGVLYAVILTGLTLGCLSVIQAEARADGASWAKTTSAEDFCRLWPDRARGLLASLDLERPELAKVRQAAEANDMVAACEALLAFYRESETAGWLREVQAEPSEALRERADAILDDTFTFYGQTDRVPRTKAGGLNWYHRGPSGDREWPLALNRHQVLRTLLRAYVATGKKRYAQHIDALLRDWVVSNAPYPGQRNVNLPWRGLEISFRGKRWAEVFYALQDDPRLRPATRLLMLSDLPHHAHHLRHFHGGGNWMTMELSALGTIAAAWPQFKDSREWMDYAKRTLGAQLRRQVYPDGVQKELTSSYHWVALHNFRELADVCRKSGRPLSGAYAEGLEKMTAYLAGAMRPDGSGPLNNDSDRRDFRRQIIAAAGTYGRPDWFYIATNGRRGEPPDDGPSIFYPWAGQVISRSGWGGRAHWSFFDVGPWGTGHQHSDKLHLSVHACGRDLLVDSGRFAYDGKIARRFRSAYARHSRGHNVLLIDGHGQAPGPREARRPIGPPDCRITEDWDYARGQMDAFAGVEGEVAHRRAVLYLRGKFWIVVDRVTTDRPRQVTALWHLHPDCTVGPDERSNGALTTDPNAGNLRLVPAGGDGWALRIVSGQDKPHPQGWYSARYNSFTRSPTIVADVRIEDDRTFAWLLVAACGKVGEAALEQLDHDKDSVILRARVSERAWRIVMPLRGDAPPQVE
jgi:hypothetical protein